MTLPSSVEIDRAVMADLARPCLYHVAGPCIHPACLESHAKTLRIEALAWRQAVENRPRE